MKQIFIILTMLFVTFSIQARVEPGGGDAHLDISAGGEDAMMAGAPATCDVSTCERQEQETAQSHCNPRKVAELVAKIEAQKQILAGLQNSAAAAMSTPVTTAPRMTSAAGIETSVRKAQAVQAEAEVELGKINAVCKKEKATCTQICEQQFEVCQQEASRYAALGGAAAEYYNTQALQAQKAYNSCETGEPRAFEAAVEGAMGSIAQMLPMLAMMLAMLQGQGGGEDVAPTDLDCRPGEAGCSTTVDVASSDAGAGALDGGLREAPGLNIGDDGLLAAAAGPASGTPAEQQFAQQGGGGSGGGGGIGLGNLPPATAAEAPAEDPGLAKTAEADRYGSGGAKGGAGAGATVIGKSGRLSLASSRGRGKGKGTGDGFNKKMNRAFKSRRGVASKSKCMGCIDAAFSGDIFKKVEKTVNDARISLDTI